MASCWSAASRSREASTASPDGSRRSSEDADNGLGDPLWALLTDMLVEREELRQKICAVDRELVAAAGNGDAL